MGSSKLELAYQMSRIRLFEERTLEEFTKGKLFGTTHAYVGQEANAVGVIGGIRRSDVVFSTHRGHGHYLAHGGDMRALAAELMGRRTGACGGIGGSQHLHFENFYSNGVQGGTVPCAAGVALAERCKGSGAIVVVFIGDGTFGEGAVYESLNIVSLWRLPILLVVENNRYAQTTPIEANLAGEIGARFRAFHIETVEVDSTDVFRIRSEAEALVASVRAACRPCALVIHTYRLVPHSKGDDFRDPAEIERFRQSDPLALIRRSLNEREWEEASQRARQEVERAFLDAGSDPWPAASDLPVVAGMQVRKPQR